MASSTPRPPVIVTRLPSNKFCLVASAAFSRGQVILQEAPILSAEVPWKIDKETQDWNTIVPNLSIVMFGTTLSFLAAFCNALPHTKCEVLDCYSAPPLAESSSGHFQDALKIAEFAKRYDWAQHQSLETLRRVIAIRLLYCLNVAALNPEAIALFPSICRVPHSCAPNALFSPGHDPGNATLIARQPIKAGEVITMSHCDLSWPATLRKQYLQLRFLFDCNCVRCTQWQDVTRVIPCSLCGQRDSKGLLPMGDEPKGFMVYDPSRPAEEAWKCCACRRTFKDSGAELEVVLEQRIYLLSRRCSDVDEVLEALATALRVVGPRHWCTIQCMVMLMDSWAKEAISGSGATDLPAVTDQVIGAAIWWSKLGGDCFHDGELFTRSILFAACATAVGGGLEKAAKYLDWCWTTLRVTENEVRRHDIMRLMVACHKGHTEQVTALARTVLKGTL